jgi:hypothetical protein
MTNTLHALDLGASYTLKRIAFINSSQAAYITFPIDTSATLSGNNNHGKSSTLRAIKFFLLPEVNLNDMERKFAFVGKQGPYSGQASFEHYFPTSRSFIILEGENTAGPYCQVLHQGREMFSYDRIFVPLAYEDIEPLFWQEDESANEGQGYPTECTYMEVWAKLKLKGGSRITSRTALRDALYTRETPTNSDTRFCMFPIPGKATDAHVESLRALLNLVFGVSKDHLPLAIATLIDQSLSGSSDDKIQIDLARITEEYEGLEAQRSHLRTLRKLQPEWKKLQTLTAQFRILHQDLKKQFVDSYAQARHLKGKATRELAPVITQEDELTPKLKSLRAEKSHAKSEYDIIEGRLKECRKRLASALEKQRKYTDLRGQYAGIDGLDADSDIISYLKTDEQGGLTAAEARFSAAQSAIKMQATLEADSKRRAVVTEQIKQLEEALANKTDSLLDQIDASPAAALKSLNEQLANVRVDIDSDERVTINKFGNLFSQAHGQLLFKGVSIPGVTYKDYNPNDATVTTEAKLAELRKERGDLDGEIQSATKFLGSSAADRVAQIAEFEKEIEDIKEEITVLSGGVHLSKQVEEDTLEVEAAEAGLTKAGETLGDITNSYLDIERTLQKVKDQWEHLDLALREAKKSSDSLRHIATRSVQLLSEPLEGTHTLAPDVEIDPQTLSRATDAINDSLNQLLRLRDEAHGHAVKLGDADIGNTQSLSEGTAKLGTHPYDEAYRIYAGEFDNIEGLEKKWAQKVESHNHTTSNQMKIIQKMESAVQAFGRAINDEVAHVRISDLESFQVNLITDHRFSGLCKDLKKHDAPTATDTLPSTEFYQRLQGFCDDFLATRAGQARLDMTKIIKDVEFTYQKGGVFENKPQSDGTSAMVNAIMLSVLIGRMTPGDVSIRMPIMFDEAGMLDEHNLPALVRSVEAHGYALFAAAPHMTMVLSRAISVHHNLSLYVLCDQDPVAPNCESIYRDNADVMKRLTAVEA